MTEENNRIFLNGELFGDPVSGLSNSEGLYGTFIRVKRLNEVEDVLPLSISGQFFERAGIKSGDSISLIGEIKTKNNLHPDGRPKLILYVQAVDLAVTPFQNSNSVSLEGYLCKQPVYRVTPKGREICDLLLAVNKPNTTITAYIPCICWGDNARWVKDLALGTKLKASGRLQSRNYSKKINETDFDIRTTYEVSIGVLNTLEGAEKI